MIVRVTLRALLPTALAFAQTPAMQRAQTEILPDCPLTEPRYWNNCKGTLTFSNGDKYVGEFRDGKRNGQGTLTFGKGGRYVGEFRDGTFNGQGALMYPSGSKYVGEFRDGKRNGQGTDTASNGDNYTGEFRNDKAHGQGAVTYANGDRYVGEFREDDGPSGKGVWIYANGDKYVGEFKDGKFVVSSPRFEVVLHKESGVLLVPVLINNKIPLDFILDSGAADVSVPADVVLTLMRTGTLTEADFMGTTTYVLADGSKVPSQTFRIRSLKIGDKVLENVPGSVASVNGPLLLGQSFLRRFKSWSIDNVRQVLVLQ